jgi:acyl transferase domain-containing protein/acyl carrier protein
VCARLRSLTGLRLPSTLTFDFPTPARLAGHVHAELTGTGTAAGESPGGSPPAPAGDPIAIVAMGCRFPGDVASPEDLWRLVSAGGDAISKLPVNRGWDLDALFGGPEQPGTCATRYGGFLHDADTFDAAFFGLSPREALGMDPQQRLLLETSWETIERAGIDPADLAGTPTGVFVGAMATDYGPRLHQPTGAADGHLLTGTALSVASGRIAYTFGLQGPALTVDTACSSSLVAIQLASSALRRGECSLALAGGVTVMSNPGNLVEFTRQNGLAVDGRAKAFSAAADGTSFAEGAGMLLLERLCDARENGHPVLALIAGGAVNSDGASNGLTAPNGQAQQQVIRQALASAGLDPAQVDAVEAHGTGTALGDPIEANAIVATYGRNRPAGQPLWLGSVKSNIGHTQAAAGVAGVIKMVLAMRHGVLPRTLHADEPTAAVDWAGGQVRLLTQQQDWVCPDRPRRAAVSGFGISGTNAHLILQAAPAPGADEPAGAGEPTDAGELAGAPPAELRPLVWMLSARTAGSLRAQAGRLRCYAASAPELDLAAAGPRLAGRPSFAHRAAVVAADRDELCAALAALADGGTHPRASTGHGAGDLQPVFVFPGQGGQWAGMARDLLAADETFAAQLRRCDEALRPHTGWSVHDVLTGAGGAPALEGSGVIQPVLFAVMVSLAEMWRSAGIEPAAVVGHSQGEIAAACVSGALSLADAAKVAALRSQVLATLDGTGGMISVSLPVADVLGKIAPWPDQLWVAADNGPSSTVVAGDPDALAQFTSSWQDTVQLRRIALDYASHCPHVEKVHDDLLARIGELAPRDTPTAICSSSIGDFIPGSALGTEYWYFNLAEQVRFDTAIRAFQDYDKPLFIEVSPHPVLAAAIAEILSDAGIDGAAIGTLHRGAGARTDFLASVAKAWVQGAAVSWPAILGARGRDVGPDRNLDLPAYAFDRQRYWLTGADRGPAAGALGHPLLAAVQPMADSDGFLLTGRISRSAVPWLADHTVGGAVLLPGTAFVELALQAAAASGAGAVHELTVQAPLVLPEIGAVDVQVTAGGPDAAGFRTLAIHSRAAGAVDADWIRHASGTLAAGDEPANRDSLAAWPPAGATPIHLTDAYDRLAEAGYEYGPAFQGLLAAWRSGTDSYAEVRLPEPVTAGARSFAMHPALLDAALHILVLDAAADADGGLLLPFSWSGIRVSAAGADRIRVRLSESADGGVALAIYDGTGRPVARVDSLTMRRAPGGGSLAAPAGSSAGLYDLNWIAAPVPALSAAQLADRQWAVVGTDPRAKDVCDALQSDGINAPLYYELASVADQVAGAVPAVVVLPYLPDVQDEADDPGYAVHEGLRQLLDVVQQWVSDERFADSRLVLVADRDTLAGAPMWGLVRSAATEHPGRFVLADVGEAAGSWGLLAAAIAAGEPQCAVRDGQVLVPRLARRTSEAAGHAAELGSGTVLVTGGTSGLGAVVAAHLVARHGVRDLLLTSRRGSAAPGAGELAERLEALGASVRIAACDVSDRRALTRLLKSVQLTGVVHAAGVLDDATVEGLSPDQLDAALHPKVDAGLLLHELTAGMPLSAFVLFSSIAGVLGNAGQANYAAANAFLDALAVHRRDLGLPAVSIAWGLWSLPTSMTAALSSTDSARLSGGGLAALTPERGLDLFDAALRETGALIAADLDLAGLSASGGETPAVLRGLVRAPRAAASAPAGAPGNAQVAGATPAGGLPDRLAALDRGEAQTMVLDLVRAQVAAALGHSRADEIELDRPFTELGFDSLTSVELRNRLGSETGLRLPTTLVFNQPTVTLLARHLLSELAPAPPAPHQVLRDAVDRVSAQLERPDVADDDQAQVIAVLQAALLRLHAPSEAAADDGESLAHLGAASDEEIFSYIDKQRD